MRSVVDLTRIKMHLEFLQENSERQYQNNFDINNEAPIESNSIKFSHVKRTDDPEKAVVSPETKSGII
jgi:hypothetical protein